ncbi:MAG: hypothetical protein MJ230_05015 [bacterium]|nr:hypothetical protein [bacterium]
MINAKYIKTFLTAIFCAVILTGSSLYTDTAKAQPTAVQTPAVVNTIQGTIAPLNVVNSPKTYLNKKITMNAKFDKFSTLGLDYKPAFKSSDDYISFLIKRDDTNFDIPLSEMKLFLKRETAEKFIDLKTNDELLIVGTVFSDALGDAWIDVESITVTKKAPEKDGVKK